jgi:hypothetical protein
VYQGHEYVFLLTKGMNYFYDNEAIKNPATPAERVMSGKTGSYVQAIAKGVEPTGNGKLGAVMKTGDTSNKRSVWNIDEEEFQQFLYWKEMNSGGKLDVWRVSNPGYKGAHFATFPKTLIEPMLLAGTSEKGCCDKCEAPWERITEDLGPDGGHQHERRGGKRTLCPRQADRTLGGRSRSNVGSENDRLGTVLRM